MISFNEKILTYIKEYNNRTVRTIMDSLLNCPSCERIKAMELGINGWTCLWRDCMYRLPTKYNLEIKRR